MAAQREEYMFVVFAVIQQRYWELTIGDEITRVADSLAGQNAIIGFFEENIAPQQTRAVDEWDSLLADFKDTTTRSYYQTKEGSFAGRVKIDWVILTYPTGNVEDCKTVLEEKVIFAEFKRLHGERPPTGIQEWRTAADPTVKEKRGWLATLVHPDGTEEELSADLRRWRFGAPLPGIAQTLNTLALAGWSVVQASEDKGLYQGEDAHDESFPSRIRYLLTRTVA